jgi:selenoprotein W-related protein
MAQELLTTFAGELGEVALVPGTGGIFEVRLNGEQLWNKKQAGRYPEPKEIKQFIRDRIAPQKDLGHSDRK